MSMIILGLIIGHFSYAQHYADNWVFGGFGLKFHQGSVSVKVDYAPHENRGMGIISDENGDLLFYSDGFSVWNRNHELMPTGNDLITTSVGTFMQESIVIPKPGSQTIYYLFTVDPFNAMPSSGLYYSIIDINLNNGLGDVVLKGQKVLNDVSNRITAVYQQNKQDVWLIVHKENTNKYYSYLLSASGLSDIPVISEGSKPLAYSWGQLKASPDGCKVVSTFDGFDLFDFNNSTGQLSNLKSFSSPISVRNYYGTEFSSDATKLFVHLQGSTGESGMYQYDLSGGTYDQINQSVILLLKERYNTLSYMQLAPNGRIYITKGGGGGGIEHLGVIENPNEYGKNCKVVENGLYLEGKESFVNHTPNFIQNYFFKTSFAVNNTCQGSLADFHVTNVSFLDSVRWYFGEGSSSNVLHPKFRYSESGDYSVRLLAYYPEKTDTIVKVVTVNPSPEFDLGGEITVCYGHELMVAEGFTSYLWNTGDSTRSIIIRESGKYKLTVSNSFGCLLTDSVFLNVEELPVVNLQDSIEIGTLDSIQVNAGNFKSYNWSTGETTSSVYVKKEGWYSVTVENETGCSSTRSFYAYNYPSQNNMYSDGWKLLNPLPSATTAQDIFFLNSQTGFILNDNQIIGTTDGGDSWNFMMSINSGKRMAFKENIGYIIGNGGAIYKSTFMGGGWNKLNVSFLDHLNAISLISKDTVLITSVNKLFVSVDGGQSWKTSDVKGVIIEDSFFTSSKVGHVACSNGTILKTIDGGANWYITSSVNFTPADINRIYFIDSDTGFASRGHNDILKTTDGGETWRSITNTSDKIYSYYFLDKQNGFIAGRYGVIFKTSNGGTTWNWIGFQNGRYDETSINSLYFIDSMTGYAVGMSGRILKTIDGGKTWKQYSPTYIFIKQLKFITDQTAYGLAGNSFLKTIDGGKSWINMGPPAINGQATQFDFVNENLGYCIAGGVLGSSANVSRVYKTTDGGKTWTVTNSGMNILSEDLYCIDFVDPLTGFVSGGFNSDSSFKTIDGGNTWQKINTISFGQIQFLNDQVGYGNSYNNIYKTIDGGKNWKVTFVTDSQIQSFHFLNENAGYFVGNNSANYKTIDGGVTWQKMELPYGYYTNVRFCNANVGYASEDYGKTYHTSNGGISWDLLNKPYSVSSIELHGTKIFAYGKSGIILENTITYDPITLVVNAASQITNNYAILTGNVTSNEGTIRDIQFEYGESFFNKSIPMLPDSVQPNGISNFSTELKDLKANTTYIYRLRGTYNGKSYSSKTLEFKTLPDFQLTMNYVYGITSDEADLSATVISNEGEISNIEFQYGINNTYNFKTVASPNSVAGETTQEIHVQLSGLIPQTRYYVRLKAVYNDSVIYSPAINFETRAEYIMQLYTPTITGNNVTVLADISAYKDTIRNIVIEYGTTREFKRQVVTSPDQINKYIIKYVSAEISGLASDSVYYYRVKANMGDKTIYSGEKVLCLAGGVIIVPTDIQKLSESSIILNGLINSNGKYVYNIQFEYGITKEMGSSVNSILGYAINNQTHVIQATLNGLLPNTKYHFRIKATNGAMNYYSEEFTYITGTTSTKDIHEGSEKVVVYPNPAHDYVEVKSAYDIKKIEFMDVNGKVLEMRMNDNHLYISNHPNGLYFLKVYTNKGMEIKKVIKY